MQQFDIQYLKNMLDPFLIKKYIREAKRGCVLKLDCLQNKRHTLLSWWGRGTQNAIISSQIHTSTQFLKVVKQITELEILSHFKNCIQNCNLLSQQRCEKVSQSRTQVKLSLRISYLQIQRSTNIEKIVRCDSELSRCDSELRQLNSQNSPTNIFNSRTSFSRGSSELCLQAIFETLTLRRKQNLCPLLNNFIHNKVNHTTKNVTDLLQAAGLL